MSGTRREVGRHTVAEHHGARRTLFFRRHCGLRTAEADRRVTDQSRMVTFPEWRTSGECAPLDGDQEMSPAEVAAGAASVEVSADADQEMAPAEVAAGAASAEVGAGADPANDQDPEADGGLNDGSAPTDPVAPPMSVGRRQPNEPTEADLRTIGHTFLLLIGAQAACRRGRDDPHRARQDRVEGNPIPVVQYDYFFFKAEKEDILCKAISAIDSVYNRTTALECEFKGLSDQAAPKHLKEYLKSLWVRKGSGARRPRRSSQQCVGPRNRWTVRVDPPTVTSHVERFHATLEGLMRTWRNDVVKRYGVSLPAHHPTVAWLGRHCAWLHDRFVIRDRWPEITLVSSPPFFETVLWREPGPHVLKFKEKWSVGICTGRDNLAVMHIILTRQGALTARLLLAVKGHPGRLKAMTDEPEVLPLPSAHSSTPIRLTETAAAQDTSAEPAQATPAGGAEESKHCEEEQSEEKIKTDTQMDDVEEEREAPVPRKRERPPTRHLPAPYSEDYHKEQETKKFFRQLERGEQAQQSSSSSSAAVPGGVDDSVEVPGKTTHQTLETVDVAPMAGVQPETQGEAEEGEPPYKTARSGDIVMVIDGETFCVPEEDVPKDYYEEDDGQVLPTEQVYEGMQRELQLIKDLDVSHRCSLRKEDLVDEMVSLALE